MIILMILAIFLATVGSIIGLIAWLIKRDNAKWMRIYNEIKIGDKFKFEYEPDTPFDGPMIFIVEIIDKTISSKNNPWVRYRFSDGSTQSHSVYNFFEWCGAKKVEE